MLDVFKIHTGFNPAYLNQEYIPSRQSERWDGDIKLLRKLGLPKAFSKADYNDLLRLRSTGSASGGSGFAPVLGAHLTFSAPKGVSIAALLGGDVRLFDAHEQAVDQTLQFLKENLPCRHTHASVTRDVPGGAIAMAVVHRCHSRALDPHLHTLITVANGAMLGDGVVRGLNMKWFFDTKFLLGGIYLAALQRKVACFGYTVEILPEGLFDIQEVPQPLRDRFSRRSEQIAEAISKITNKAKADLPSSSIRVFTEKSTPKLPTKSYNDVFQEWSSRLVRLGLRIDPPTEFNNSKNVTAPISHSAALINAYLELQVSKRNGVKVASLLLTALRSDHRYCIDDLVSGVAQLVDSGA